MLNEKEIEQASTLLSMLEPGFLPLPIFLQVMRLSTASIIEIVPLRKGSTGTPEVLLTKRPSNDTLWPDALHTPGVVIRPTDKSYDDAFERILKAELKGPTVAGEPVFVQYMLHSSKRGKENALIFYIELTGEAPVGAFYPINELPTSLIESQRSFIRAAAAIFTAI